MPFRLLAASIYIFLLSSCQTVLAQDFYVIDTLYNVWTFGTDTRSIIDINTCELSTTTTDWNPLGVAFHPLDMTITGEVGIGIPISLSIDNDPDGNNIPEDVIVYHFWQSFVTPGVGPLFTPESSPKGLATDYYFESYLVGDYISHVDDIDDIVTPLGLLPLGQRPKGQMTYREGSFYYPSESDELIQLKVSGNDYWIRSLGSLPDTLNYGGIFSIPVTCDSTDTYVLHHDPDRGSTLYHLDISSVTLTQHCTMPLKPSAAAYDGENTLPPCDPLVLDLDTGDAGTINRFDSICAGTIYPLDLQTQLSPDLEFDSLVVTLQNPLDALDEAITVSATHPEVLVSSNSADQLTLASTGFTKAGPLLEVLAGLEYMNNAASPTLGQRIIEITAHHPHYGTTTASVFIEVVNEGSTIITPDLSEPGCFGDDDGSIDLLLTNTESYEVVWEDGSDMLPYTNLSSGMYSFELTDDSGCRYDDDLILGQPDTLTLTITADQDSICGNNGLLTGIPLGGTTDYDYSWSSGDDTDQAGGLAPGTYILTVQDANDCEATAEYTLYNTEMLSGEFEETGCLGQPISVNSQDYSQDTTFQQMLTTAEGCDSLLDVQLTFFDTFYTFSAFELCPGESINLYDQFITQDTNFLVTLSTEQGCDSLEYYEVSFSPPVTTPLAAEICQDDTYSFAGSTLATSGVYYDTLTASSGCDSLLELTLTVNALPEVVIEQNGSLCNGDVVDLSLDNGFAAIVWNDGSTASQLEVSAAGSYGVTATDNNGCSNTASITLTDDPPVISFVVQNPACPEGNGALEILSIEGGLPPYQIESSGQVISPGDVISGLAVGSYDYMIQDAAACTTSINFQITPENTLTVDLPEELSIKLGESIEIPVQTTTLPSQINWSPPEGLDCADCLMPVASPTQSTRYFLNLEDQNGCRWEGSTFIKVAIPGLYIPNAFSPNGDGSNDTFAPVPNDAVSSIKLFSIFDRWGAQVFRSSASTTSWDGSIKGQLASQGVYVYFVEWIDKAGNLRLETGEVLLLY